MSKLVLSWLSAGLILAQGISNPVDSDIFEYIEKLHLISNLAWSPNLPFTVIGATQGLVDWDALETTKEYDDEIEEELVEQSNF